MKREYNIEFIDNLASGEPEVFANVTADSDFTYTHLSRLIKDLHPDTIKITKKEGSSS